MKRKIIISILFLLIASFSLIDEDLIKFILVGRSGTYGITLVKHGPLVVFGISAVFIVLNIFLAEKKYRKFVLGLTIVISILFQRTYAVYDNSHNANKTFVSGISIFQISKCEITDTDDCMPLFGYFLKDEIKRRSSSRPTDN